MGDLRLLEHGMKSMRFRSNSVYSLYVYIVWIAKEDDKSVQCFHRVATGTLQGWEGTVSGMNNQCDSCHTLYTMYSPMLLTLCIPV